MEKYICVKFSNIWKKGLYEVTNDEKVFLEKGFKFYYNDETTVQDLLLFFNKKFEKLNQEQNEIKYSKINNEKSLKYLYRLVYKEKIIFLFDLKMKIRKLVSIIKTENLTFLLTIFVEKGGNVLYIKGMNFFFHSREKGKHHLPHIHVKYNEYEAEISLGGSVLHGYLPTKKLKVAKQIIEENKYSFLLKWNDLTDGEKFEFNNDELVRIF